MTGPTARLDSNQPAMRDAAGHVAHTDDRAGQLVAQLPGPVTERRAQMAPVPTKARRPALPRQEQHHHDRPEGRPRKAAPMLAAAPPVSPTIDRSACPSTRGHGTVHHRYKNGCTCPDGARAAKRMRWRIHTRRLLAPYVDSAGTARQLQAAAYRGHTLSEVCAALGGMDRAQCVRLREQERPVVRRETAEQVRRVVAELHEQPEPADPVGGGSGSNAHARTRSGARRKGWLPLGAWDDIDDPAETPDRSVLRAVHEPRKLAIEDVEWLASTLGGSHDDAEIARHYGVTIGAVQTCRARATHARRTDARRPKLTDADAHAIRAEYTADPHGFHGETVAARYGVTGAVISRLITGKTRAHLGLTDLTAHPRGDDRADSPARDAREENAA